MKPEKGHVKCRTFWGFFKIYLFSLYAAFFRLVVQKALCVSVFLPWCVFNIRVSEVKGSKTGGHVLLKDKRIHCN